MSRDQRVRRRRQATFRCRHCRLDVPIDAPGTMHRNHCPSCLWSRHIDDRVPGDRAAPCAASMEPIAICVHDDGEWALVHRCGGCATVRVNRIAGDDNPHVLVRLASRPFAKPPFPLDGSVFANDQQARRRAVRELGGHAAEREAP